MRLLWLIVLVCFLGVSMHEVVDHAGPCTCATESTGDHHDTETGPADSPHTDEDHHGGDSHGHFRGAVSAPTQSINKDLAMPAAPVVFDAIGIQPQEHLVIWREWSVHPPARDLPQYLSAHSLLL